MSLRGPLHRSILALDLENSTARTNLVKVELRHQLYLLLRKAMDAAGIDERHCEPITDRGDGLVLLMHPVDEVPRSRLLAPLIPVLAGLLAEYNASLPAAERPVRQIRLRAVIHSGDLLGDEHGLFGTELDAAIRLLDAPAVRCFLRSVPVPLVLVVSQQIYESVVFHGYDGIRPASYRRAVEVSVCGLMRYGWIHVPVVDPAEPAEEPPDAACDRPA